MVQTGSPAESPLQRRLDIVFWCFSTVEFRSIRGENEVEVGYLGSAET